jgi:hypothetical protein
LFIPELEEYEEDTRLAREIAIKALAYLQRDTTNAK